MLPPTFLSPPTFVYIYTPDSKSSKDSGTNMTTYSANVSFQDQRSASTSSLPAAAASSHHQNILSHLPLHSQQQACSLLPVVPIGGVQMMHSPPSSSAPSPESSEGQRCSSAEGSVHRPEAGIGQLSDNETKPNLGASDTGQEENVQTCLKAIASLKITTEDPH